MRVISFRKGRTVFMWRGGWANVGARSLLVDFLVLLIVVKTYDSNPIVEGTANFTCRVIIAVSGTS